MKFRSKLWPVWYQMNYRCSNPKHNRWKHYGGRGIRVCKRWQNFENFLKDMAAGYRPGLMLERIDNDRNYTPANCKWATTKEQTRNRANNVWVDTPVGPMVLTDAGAWSGIKWLTLRNRINSGWPKANLFDPVVNGGDRRSPSFKSKSVGG